MTAGAPAGRLAVLIDAENTSPQIATGLLQQAILTLARPVEPVSHALALIQAAIEDIGEDDGWTKLHAIGTALLTRSPGFKPRCCGRNRFSSARSTTTESWFGTTGQTTGHSPRPSRRSG